MSVFDSFTRKVSDKAKAAARKSSELVEVTRLNMSIGSEEEKIEELYRLIGKMVYEKYGDEEEVNEELRELCDRIRSHQAAINAMRKKIMELKKVKKCPNCEAELDLDMAFCPRCGQKQEIPQPETETQEVEESPENKFCSSCGKENPADSNFCSECGARL